MSLPCYGPLSGGRKPGWSCRKDVIKGKDLVGCRREDTATDSGAAKRSSKNIFFTKETMLLVEKVQERERGCCRPLAGSGVMVCARMRLCNRQTTMSMAMCLIMSSYRSQAWAEVCGVLTRVTAADISGRHPVVAVGVIVSLPHGSNSGIREANCNHFLLLSDAFVSILIDLVSSTCPAIVFKALYELQRKILSSIKVLFDSQR